MLGLKGETSEGVNAEAIASEIEQIRAQERLQLGGTQDRAFEEARDVQYHR